jgi:hypothetical protein
MVNIKRSKKTKRKYSKRKNNYIKSNKKSNKKKIKNNKKILQTKKYKIIGGMKYMIYDGKKSVFKYIETLDK